MFNLNIPTTSSLLGVESVGGGGGGVSAIPKTPEIVNSLIAMTNPLDNYQFSTLHGSSQQQSLNAINNSANSQMISQDSSHSSCSGSPLESPAGTNTTPSVQQTCSQLIKAGLKLSIQSKRKMSSCDSSSGTEQPSSKYARKSIAEDTSEEDTEHQKSPKTGLTPEDEDRRRRRRERNKIAATKCRMKKRERTMNLVSESEVLETQNIDLKTQVRNLETERRKLFDMLQAHNTACVCPGGFNPPANLCQSPAFKYLNDLGLENGLEQSQQGVHDQQSSQQRSQSHQQQRTVIPPMNTIKYSRNGIRQNHHQHHHHNPEQQQQHPQHQSPQEQHLPPNHNDDLLSNGYCKPSPPQSLSDNINLNGVGNSIGISSNDSSGYLNSPIQQDCLHQAAIGGVPNHSPSLQQHLTVGVGVTTIPLGNGLLKTDSYIPNNENTNGCSSTVSSSISLVDTNTADFVLKSELVDSQSPYTTAQSAERFLFETNCENFDIKHSNLNSSNSNDNNNSHSNSNLNTNNNNITMNNNNTLVDFHPHLSTTPISSCQTYDNLLLQKDFLAHDSELLTQLTDGTESEFIDLDSGVTAGYAHLTNGGCLA